MQIGPLKIETESSFDYSKLPEKDAKELKQTEIEIKQIMWNFYKKTGMTIQEYEEKVELLEKMERGSNEWVK